MMTFDIRYATTAEQSLYSQISHLEPYLGYAGAEKKLSGLIIEAEALLAKNPFAYPISRQASLLGVTHYRELNHLSYRLLYECYEDDQLVVVSLILGERQSVEEQLINYCLMFDR